MLVESAAFITKYFSSMAVFIATTGLLLELDSCLKFSLAIFQNKAALLYKKLLETFFALCDSQVSAEIENWVSKIQMKKHIVFNAEENK